MLKLLYYHLLPYWYFIKISEECYYKMPIYNIVINMVRLNKILLKFFSIYYLNKINLKLVVSNRNHLI